REALLELHGSFVWEPATAGQAGGRGEAAAGDGATLPLSPVERALAEIWSEVLRREVVAAEEDFFALGGHSLLAVQVVHRIQLRFDVDLPLRTVFESPTLRGQAAMITARLAGSLEEDEMDRLVAELESLEEEE